jgi:hypothetical protein
MEELRKIPDKALRKDALQARHEADKKPQTAEEEWIAATKTPR